MKDLSKDARHISIGCLLLLESFLHVTDNSLIIIGSGSKMLNRVVGFSMVLHLLDCPANPPLCDVFSVFLKKILSVVQVSVFFLVTC